jgi:hypothetical protein
VEFLGLSPWLPHAKLPTIDGCHNKKNLETWRGPAFVGAVIVIGTLPLHHALPFSSF